MNAHEPKLIESLALTREPLPASRKDWIAGSRADLRVPVREVRLTNGETVALYDTSGPYSDPTVSIDVKRGLPDLRAAWTADRGDTESYDGRAARALDDGAKNEQGGAERIAKLRAEAAALQRRPRRAKSGRAVTQMHYARRGIVTPEWSSLRCARTAGASGSASICPTLRASSGWPATRWGAASGRPITPEFVRQESRADGPSFRPTSITSSWSRWRSAAISWSRSTPTSATRR